MTGSGARLRAARLLQSEEFLRSLGMLVVAPPRRSGWPWILGVRRLFGPPYKPGIVPSAKCRGRISLGHYG